MNHPFTRRKFLKRSSALGLGISLLSNSLLAYGLQNAYKTEAEPLKILILGGTSFLGPHLIANALERGHQITTFTRGKSKPLVHQKLFSKVTNLIGDRKDNLEALNEGEWDIVIDNSGYDSEWTKNSARLLKDRAKLYMYTSSVSVFYPFLDENIQEGRPLLLKEPEGIEDDEMKMEYWYGVMKANSEIEAIKEFGKEKTTIIRPTFMIGPGDKSDRFIYWPVRLAKGGEVLIPGKSTDAVQYIDVRDIAKWMIRLAENKVIGTFNAAGPENIELVQDFVRKASKAFTKQSRFVEVDDYEFLKKHNVPYLVPWCLAEGNNYGLSRASNAKAKKHGLTFRDVAETTKDTYNWWMSENLTQQRRDKFELKPEGVLVREKEILKAWKALKQE